VPKATIIGFTGTPIARTSQGEGTFKIFGSQDELGYLDKYSIAESIADETTLPIKYVMAPSTMTVPPDPCAKHPMWRGNSGQSQSRFRAPATAGPPARPRACRSPPKNLPGLGQRMRRRGVVTVAIVWAVGATVFEAVQISL
jgi:Type I site-specific restriction-modification system, R (restriction) subunit and related helicases